MPLVLIDHAYGRALPMTGRPFGFKIAHRAPLSGTMANAYRVNMQRAAAVLRTAILISARADWPCCLYHLKAWILAPHLVGRKPPAQGRVSHLQAERDTTKAGPVLKYRVRGLATASEWMRRKVSARAGHEKGQR